jgi:SPP1 family predicted phage head-tail adaptor
MRYRSDISEKDKLVFRGNEYQIRSIINIEERNRYSELVIEKGQAQ